MKKSILILALLGLSGMANARVTGTPASGVQDDAWCVGPSGAEVCVDVNGNLLPSTDSDTTLGTSSLYWSNAYIDAITTTGNVTVGGNLSVTGTSIVVMPSTQTLTNVSNATQLLNTDACGTIKRLAEVTNITNATFAAASSTNAGCITYVVNTGGGLITFNTSANFKGPLPSVSTNGIELGTNDAMIVGQMGGNWIVLGTWVINN